MTKTRTLNLADAKRYSGSFNERDAAYVRKHYDLCGVLRKLAGDPDAHADMGLAREMHAELAKDRTRSARGLLIPTAIFDQHVRTMTGKTNVENHITGNGVATVKTDLLSDQFIHALVARTILPSLGVSFVGGLVGDVAIPTGTSVSASWMTAEDGDAQTASPAFSQRTATPHTVAGRTIISRRLLMQSSISVDALVRELLTSAVGRAIEQAVFDGTGTNGQPLGISNTSGVNTCDFDTAGTATKADLQRFWTTLHNATAAGLDLAFVGSPAVKALLAQSRDALYFNNTGSKATSGVIGAVGGDYLCTKDGKVEGLDYHISNLCSAKKLYCGAWSEVNVLGWGEGVDVLVDPYSRSSAGALAVNVFHDVDVVVRQPAAFAVGTALA